MTVPACTTCNAAYSQDEERAAAVICTVSFTKADREAVDEGGWVHSAMQRNRVLQEFVGKRLGNDGIFRPDQTVIETLSRVITQTAVGLLFFEFGQIVHREDLRVIAVDHAKNIDPASMAELYRRDDSGWAEVTPSGRELERQLMAVEGVAPPHMPDWRVYIPEFFEYMLLRRSNRRLMCAMKLHDALTFLLECPWPARAGPLRKGRSPAQ